MFRALVWVAVACAAAWSVDRAVAEEPLVLAVMDPLAAPLSCPCVEGYAQRDYNALAAHLKSKLGRDVVVGFGESLQQALDDVGAKRADVVIGKHSVVVADAKHGDAPVTPVAQLVGRDGVVTQTGMIVVPANDPAESVSDLEGYEFYFGPEHCEEKHTAAIALLSAHETKPGKAHVSAACSDGAAAIVERFARDNSTRAAAVISSYAAPLLEGCGTIAEGDLRVIAHTKPVRFVTAFVSDAVDDDFKTKIAEALLTAAINPKVAQALESTLGFVVFGSKDITPPTTRPSVDQTSARASPADNKSWPGFRGPNRDNVMSWLPDRLPTSPRFVWRQPLARSGLGGIAVADGKVVIGDRDFTNEFDVWRCFDAATGEELWDSRYPAPGRLDYDNAPRATPLLQHGKAYLLGAFGRLSCVDLETGDRVWRRDLRRSYGDSGRLNWGACCSPLLAGGVLVVCPAADNATWLGLDPETGRTVWVADEDRHGFASPIVVGEQFVAYDGASLGGWSVATGKRLWSHQPPEGGDFNVPTPALLGNRLAVVSENNGLRLFDFATAQLASEPLGAIAAVAPDTSSPTVWRDRLLLVYEGLRCFEAGPDGELTAAWVGQNDAMPEVGRALVGHTKAGAGRALVVGKGGCLLLIDADADDFRVVSRLNLFEIDPLDSEDLLCQPAIVGDRLYLRTEEELVCVALSDDA